MGPVEAGDARACAKVPGRAGESVGNIASQLFGELAAEVDFHADGVAQRALVNNRSPVAVGSLALIGGFGRFGSWAIHASSRHAIAVHSIGAVLVVVGAIAAGSVEDVVHVEEAVEEEGGVGFDAEGKLGFEAGGGLEAFLEAAGEFANGKAGYGEDKGGGLMR